MRLRMIAFLASIVFFAGCALDPDAGTNEDLAEVPPSPAASPSSMPEPEPSPSPEPAPEESPPPFNTISETVWLNPDGSEFAEGLGYSYFYDNDGLNSQTIQIWDTGEKTIEFKKWINMDRQTFLDVNGYTTLVDYNRGLAHINVAEEFIIVVTHGTDIRSNYLNILDYSGNILLEVYYLNNKGMVIDAIAEVDDNRILMRGSRWHHDDVLHMSNSSYFPRFSEYWYIDTEYDHDFCRYVVATNPETAAKLHPDEIVSADFMIEYLGDGKFSTIQMIGNIMTFGEWLEYEREAEIFRQSLN
jgi:hypothetical protein